MASWNPLGVADYGSDSEMSQEAPEDVKMVATEEERNEIAVKVKNGERKSEKNEVVEIIQLPELPPVAKGMCSKATQAKVDKYLAHTERGLSFTSSLRSKKEFDNPYILEKVVNYFDIEEMQSNLDKTKFNPYGYHVGDNYNRLALAVKNKQEELAQIYAGNPALRWTQPKTS
ncbi:hypothetical protein THRCLA_10472 [Thraustotheca clavata]|uniref:Uncharacterized protein n=1 Tax=Thraustotheca clavata TaxID=74557 RepID=A0A1V9YNF8_9STRA|nr:hypothetical protein THRCLA_10472 [Thraustotheca clavata]